jgi:ribonuclease E
VQVEEFVFAPAPAGTDDPIAEALNELGRTRRSRNRRPVSDSGTAASEDVLHDLDLQDLAQAIASDESEPAGDEDGDDTPRRRRRRRGGRNRRRTGRDFQEREDEEDEEVSEAADENQGEAPEESDGETEDDGATHRRRRRRRRGEEVDDETAADAEVVVKVREPRSTQKPARGGQDVTGIDGSTRLEAKKQRRREGRAASRRRAPILSEAEFLTRRESVERKMLIRQKEEYSQIAVVEDGVLVEHYVDRASATSLIGNIYLGKIQNVLPGMEAAFIDIGRGRNAVLYAGEVDWDSFGEAGANRKIEEVFSAGQLTLVQVSKDPVGAKGARLTSHISIPGRYVVYAPQGHISGISRKLSEIERNRLKSILDSLVGEKASVVIRTAAEGASEEELVHDINRLKAQWEVIEKKTSTGKQSPQLLYAEPDLTMRIVRDLFTEDFTSLVVDGNGGMEDSYEVVEAYVQHVAPHLADRIVKWDRATQGDLFANYRIDEQIAKALDNKVHLPSGGSLVIDRTEAMTVIDVNTGKFTGSGGNLEATVTANNLEAAEEIVRQLRLRDIGGIIIVDFIDMVLATNRELLLRRLIECLARDRTRHQVSEVTSLGLVQLTRKKVGTGLAEAFTKVCETCGGEGHIRYEEPVDTQAPADGGERHARTSAPRTRRKN